MRLSWTAPGSGGELSHASSYDIRYSQYQIDDGNWYLADLVGNPPLPADSGSAEEFILGGLPEGLSHYVAIRSRDEYGNISPLSNVLQSFSSGIQPPLAIDTRVDPDQGSAILVASPVESYLPLYYEFALDTADAFVNPRMGVAFLIDTTVTCVFDSLIPTQVYYWRCHAVASDQSYISDWSNTVIFNSSVGISQLFTEADCIFPTEAMVVQTSQPTFTVRNNLDAIMAFIQVSDNIAFSSPVESGPIAATPGLPVTWRIVQPLSEGPRYYWRVSSDNISWTSPVSFTAEIDVHPYPNPYRVREGHSNIVFTNLPQESKIIIATVSGNVVREINDVGPDDWSWDVKNDDGAELASGVYLYRVDSPDGSSSGKVMIIK
jgi:hypothetical protein